MFREYISKKSQEKLERIKIHETDFLKAHKELYDFTETAFLFYPPGGNAEDEFYKLMRHFYDKQIKSHKLYYDLEIRKILDLFESQYRCLSDTDLNPQKSFNDFYKNDYLNLVQTLQNKLKKEQTRFSIKQNERPGPYQPEHPKSSRE